jgi:uncharacterized membrane protein YccC
MADRHHEVAPRSRPARAGADARGAPLLSDPGRAALKKALRAAIAIPAVFAFADKVVQQPQSTTFAVFGSFALLVLADFRGSPRARLSAYAALFVVGAAFIALGTLCSPEPWVGAAAMAIVALVVLSSSAITPYVAMGGWAPLLTFILPVTLPADPSAIPQRLGGWALACAVAVPAAMWLWPPRPTDALREAVGKACRRLATFVAALLDGDPLLVDERGAAARSAVASARWTFTSTPYRPTGATGATEALAFLVDELDSLLAVALPQAGAAELARGPCADENRAVLAAVTSVLEASAAMLDGAEARPDLERLDAARDALTRRLALTLAELPDDERKLALMSAAEPPFRVSEMSLAAREIGTNALRAAGRQAPLFDATSARSALDASRVLARGYGSIRSVLLRNSVRGAVALAVAVLIAREASLQHGFWVVLGTLSVLRSNALGTGSSVVKALTGTSIGLLAGVALVLAAGTHEAVLWVLFPPAVLLAAYAPQAISFAAGQAGFTVTLLILFNLIQPTGWTVGLVRIEDVAIGFAVSLGVGALFWPRGAAALMRDSLATSYARSADYVAAAVQQLVRGGDSTRARLEARAAAHRLDDVFRQYLGELSGDRTKMDDLATLLAGATRVRLAAYSLSTLPHPPDGDSGRAHDLDALDSEARRLRSWYAALGEALSGVQPPPAPDDGTDDDRVRILQSAHEAAARDGGSGARLALSLLWAAQQLDNLRRLEPQLAGAAGELAGRPPERRREARRALPAG